MPRAHNQFADALATMASMINLTKKDSIQPLKIEVRGTSAYCLEIEECCHMEEKMDGKPWSYDIKKCIQKFEYLLRVINNEKSFIRCMAGQFFLSGETLYKRTYDTTLLQCVNAAEATRLIQELHEGLVGAHKSGPSLARRI